MARARLAVGALQSYYFPAGADLSIWGVGWWHDANAMEALVTYMQRGGGGDSGVGAAPGALPFLGVLRSVYARQPARTVELSSANDDVGHWGLAWARAFELTGNATYLARAQLCFAQLAEGWDDDGGGSCGGGLWWTTQRQYKNAITNELFLALAARLHLLLPLLLHTPANAAAAPDAAPARPRLLPPPANRTYLEWAQTAWAWFEGSGLVGAAPAPMLVSDGLQQQTTTSSSCRPAAPAQYYTYNSGVVLGGLAWLYVAGGARNGSLLAVAQGIADAAIEHYAGTDGVLLEACDRPAAAASGGSGSGGRGRGRGRGRGGGCDADGQSFKGIFARYVRHLVDVLPSQGGIAGGDKAAEYREWLARNAQSVWARDRAPATAAAPMLLGPSWEGPLNATDADDLSIATRSALDVLLTQI